MPRLTGRSMPEGMPRPHSSLACAEKKSTNWKCLLVQAWRKQCPASLSRTDQSANLPLVNEAANNEHGSIQPTGEVKIQPVSAVPKDDCNNNDACCTAMKCYCEIQIDYLNHQVAALQRQLNFVLSYVGITEQPDTATSVDCRFMSATRPRDSDKKSDNIATAAKSLLSNKPPLSYSAVTQHHGVSQPGQRRQITLKESIVTAVYVDQSIKNSRSSTVVVTGLQPSHVTSDKSLFTNLCDFELGSRPSIVLTKSLGQSQSGRTQPLLVVLADAKNAQQLIKSAKQLRSSTNAEVKAYVNPNLTKAEAAFLIREYRRQRHRQNTSTVTDHGQDSQSPSISNQLVHTNEGKSVRMLSSLCLNPLHYQATDYLKAYPIVNYWTLVKNIKTYWNVVCWMHVVYALNYQNCMTCYTTIITLLCALLNPGCMQYA